VNTGMNDPRHPRMTRGTFLKGALAAGGSVLLGACGGSSGDSGGSGSASTKAASHPPIGQEPGSLAILDYAGYESKPLWTSYRKEFPGKTPHWTFYNSDAEALSKTLGGYRGDVSHPCSGYVKSWADADLIEPWDTSLLTNFKDLNPGLLKRGQVDGKQYQIPSDWGYISLMYRPDKIDVDPSEVSWSMMFDSKKYPGRITWYDNPADMLFIAGYVIGADDPFNMSDEELDAAKAKFIEAKPNVRNFWNSQSGMQQDFASGNAWITYAWPSDWQQVSKKVKAEYSTPKEGRLAFDCGFSLFKGSKNYFHAHKYVDSWVSPQSGEWLLNNFAYGSSNTAVDLDKVPKTLVDAFSLKDPSIIDDDSKVHVIRYNPRQAQYDKAWQEIKAA
jgi:spermidine/putrescine transport system substrate-binding protein